jgi:glutathione S-transferase
MTTSEKPVLHQYQVSPFSAKVRRCLYFKEVDFETVNYGISGLGKIRKMNPRSKLPVLEHRGEMIPDSTDIIRYLESSYPDKPVIPKNSIQYAQAHILEDWGDESLYFYDLTMRSWPNNGKLLANDLLLDDPGILKKLFGRLVPKIIAKQAYGQGIGRKDRHAVCAEAEEHFRAINAIVAGKQWLVGNALSIADITIASMCTVLERAEEAKAMMSSLRELTDWRDRVDAATLPKDTPADLRALA